MSRSNFPASFRRWFGLDFYPPRIRSGDEFRKHIVEKSRGAVIEVVPGHSAYKADGANGEDFAASRDRQINHVGSHLVGV
jgi:hypothetical protein